jgi:hypothetical protein
MRSRVLTLSTVFAVVAATCWLGAGALAGANTSNPSGIPYTCTTNPNFGNQPATYGATITDSLDPATVGATVTYQFVVPFDQPVPPIAVTYKGGTVTYPIPTGLQVTSVSTPAKAGSNITATAKVVGNTIVVTSTGNQPVDGNSHPTPDLFVTGKVLAAAAGPGVVWKTPSQLVATVNNTSLGDITATCTPDAPNTVIATTAVPAAANAPVAKAQSISVAQGKAKAITLTATDADTPQSQLTFAVTTPPTHGALTGTAPNVTYTSDPSYTGADSFQFSATDPGGLSGSATVSIRVYAANVIDNTPPAILLLTPANGAVYTPNQVVNAAFGCSDANTEVSACTGTVATGAAVSTTLGHHSFTVQATDSQGNKALRSVSYRVIDPARVHQVYDAGETIPLSCTSTTGASTTSVPAVVSAPTQIGTGRTFTFRFAPGAGSVPLLTTATNIAYTLDVPINGVVQSASVVSGTGTVTGTATVTNGQVVLAVAGPIAGGSTTATAYTPPTVDVVVQASGLPNAAVQTRLAGYRITTAPNNLPQLAMTRTCTAGTNTTPNPVLTRTTVIDTTPPAITLDQPANGSLFKIGDVLASQFACTDETGVGTCTGTKANGAAIDTATAAKKTFLVTATDASGNTAQAMTSYTVVQATFVANFTPDQIAAVDGAAAYYNTDRVGLLRMGIAIVGYVVAVNGPPENTVSPPPANTGSVSVSVSYSAADAQSLSSMAGLYGLTGDQLHRWVADVLVYVWIVRTQ